MKEIITREERDACLWFKICNGDVRFIAPLRPSYLSFNKDETIFSYAIAKFQDLVRFEQ
jgi:hypothetical protein